MSGLNDDKYKKLLQSVHVDFDKDLLWKGIDHQMQDFDEKRKRKRFMLWVTGFAVILIFSVTTLLINKTQNRDVAQNSEDEHFFEKTINDLEENGALVENLKSRELEATDFELTASNSREIDLNSKEKLNTSDVFIPLKNIEKYDDLKNVVEEFSEDLIQKHVLIKSIDPVGFTPESTTMLVTNQLAALEEDKYSLKSNGLDKEITAVNPIVENSKKANNLASSIRVSSFYGGLNAKRDFIELETKEFYQAINESTSAQSDAGVVLSYEKGIYKNFSLVPSLYYSLKTERFNGIELSISNEEIVSDSASFFEFEDGQMAYYAGDIEQVNYEFRRVQHYNKSHAFGAGLSLQYNINSANWNIFISGGLAYNYSFLTNGKTWGPESRIIDIANSDIGERGNFVNITQIGVERKLTKLVYLSGGFIYRSDFQRSYSYLEVDNSFTSFSGQLGLKFIL